MTTKYSELQISERFDVNSIFAKRLLLYANKKNFLDDVGKMISEKPKPFVKWVGGKRQLLKQFRLRNLYPPEKFNPIKNKYFEPFVGGGAVFFDLLPKNAVISDLNKELITTYKIIRDNPNNLIKSLKKHKINKEYFLKVRAKDPNKLSDLDVASRFIFLNRTAFNGLYRVNSSGQYNVPFGKYKNPLICDEVNIKRVSSVLKGVDILNQDYKEVLKNAKKGDFVYFDPPYYPVSRTSSFTSYTKESFLDKAQIELRDVFLRLTKKGCFVMLSNSDTQFINKIYSGFKGVRINKVYAGRAINSKASRRGKITEVLITNY